MSVLDAVIQGIIQGLTEFLPVSSSGHLSIWQHFTGTGGESGEVYAVLLHLGTLAAVIIAFRKEFFDMLRELFKIPGEVFSGKFDGKNSAPGRRMIFLLFISLIPLCFFYFLADFYNSLAADDDIVAEGLCFLLTAVLLLVSGKCVKIGGRTAENMTWKDALAMGITQGVAPLPGLSRSGSTISVGLIMGVSREQAVAFSFIMGLPAVAAANLLELPKIFSGGLSISPAAAIFGTAAAAATGFAAIKTVKLLVKNDKFTYFAWYLLPLGMIITAIGIYEHLTGSVIRL